MSALWSLLGYSSSQKLWDSAKFSIIKTTTTKVDKNNEKSDVSNITITEVEIGRGCYGVIYEATYKGKKCIAKEINHNIKIDDISPNTIVESFVEKINILSTLRHPNIVHFLGVNFRETPMLIMEKMWANLTTLLADKPAIPLAIKVSILKDVACGLEYLHCQNPPVIHCDLITNNILLNKNLDAKLADTGLVKALEDITRRRLSTTPEALACMPPEMLIPHPEYKTQVDIFSFGCVTVHTVIQEFPNPTDQNESSEINKEGLVKISERSRRKRYIDKMSDLCPDLTYLATACLKDDPDHRPDAEKIRSWLEKYWEKPERKEHQREAIFKYCQSDKYSLIASLSNESVRVEKLQSEVESFRSEVQKLTNSTLSKNEEISSLQKSNNDQQVSIQSQQSEIDQLKSQCEKLSQQSSSEIVMNLSSMLRQEQEDMKEKQEEIKNLKMKLNKVEKNYANLKKESEEEEQEFQRDDKLWKAKAESTTPTDKDISKKMQEIDQEQEKLKEQVTTANLLSKNHLMEFNKSVMEIQVAKESYTQREKQMRQWQAMLEKQRKEISEFKQKLSNAKSTNRQQLDEKSLRLSLLQPQLNACQQKLDIKDKELSDMQSQNENLQKQLENVAKLHTTAQKDIAKYKTAFKQEVKISKEVSTNESLQSDLQKCQDPIEKKDNEVTLLNETLQKCQEINLQHQGKIKNLEKEIKKLTISHSKSSRQLEAKLKEKSKYIESLEKKSSGGHYCHYRYSLHWSPYLSLPVKRIKPSAAVVKDKVFITGGYQGFSPQGREMDTYLKSLERGDEVFCFNTTKCRCDSIASPVVLGGVASVNGQCVLVSGAEGNTLTGNVYVLCEEGSDEQWKKFSETVPTPRILPCVCCYGERWMIVCGGYTCKEGSNLLEAVNVVEILDTAKGEWYTLPEAGIPNLSTILACNVVGDDVYITGDDKVLKSDCSKLVSVITASSDNALWTEVPVVVEERDEDFHPFSIVEVNGEPMIIASISGSEDDATCVLIKDTTDTWRKMSEAVECQHCSAVVVTPTLELLFFGGSENVQLVGGTDVCQNGTLIPALNIGDDDDEKTAIRSSVSHKKETTLMPNQPPAILFTGPIHSQQFDHKGGTFQSPVHKVSIVVPPNAIEDGEKVTVHMGATTSGPFDLPEDCKLRSAVVWLGSESDVVLKRNIAVVVPHSAVFTCPQHHFMMRFLTCEEYKGSRYNFKDSQGQFEIDEDHGWIELNKFSMVAIAASPKYTLDDQCNSDADVESDDEFFLAPEEVEQQEGSSPKRKTLRMPPARYLTKLFWPRGQVLNSFRADVYYLHNLPTELYKVNTLYRKAYYEDNGAYPEIVETEFMIDGDGTELKCVLPCSGSSECDCLSGWSVTQMNDISEVYLEKNRLNYKTDPMRFSFKFNCCDPKQNLVCCFEFQGVESIIKHSTIQIPNCLQKRYDPPNNLVPFIIQQITHQDESAVEHMHAHHIPARVEEGSVIDSPQVKNLL